MSLQTQITEALAAYGISEVAFYDVPETRLTSIRITDQEYADSEVVGMIAMEIIEPLGLEVSMYGSRARYTTDDKVGAVVVVRGLQ